MPLSAVEDESEKLLLPEELLPQGHVFLLRVRGDAMEDETIFDGDLVLINADEPVVDMDIGAVSVDDEVTLKKVHYFDGYVVLIPANSKYDPCPPKRAGEVRILGRWESTIHHRRR